MWTALRREFKPAGEVRNLAVRISGTFKTAFPDGKPKAAQPQAGEPAAEADINPSEAPLKEGRSAAVIVVVADSDLLYDGYYLSQQNLLGFTMSNIFNDNLNFMLNTCEMLTGNPALISIRSRGTFERPFTRVQALERKAQDRWLDQEQMLVRQVEETNEKLRLLDQQKDASQQARFSAKNRKKRSLASRKKSSRSTSSSKLYGAICVRRSNSSAGRSNSSISSLFRCLSASAGSFSQSLEEERHDR
jgi:ABC-type uncharacterized transport system involved in gliding motility auxiliary subunit